MMDLIFLEFTEDSTHEYRVSVISQLKGNGFEEIGYGLFSKQRSNVVDCVITIQKVFKHLDYKSIKNIRHLRVTEMSNMMGCII